MAAANPDEAPVVELRDVWLERDGIPALEGVDLRIDAGDYLAILGPNGGGKTTLLLAILGLLRPQRGTLEVLGQPPERARGQLGYVPQHARFDLGFPIEVDDVVRMGRLGRRRLGRGATADDRRAVERAIEVMEVAPLLGRPIGALSGGQLQRVLIARALAMEPRILLLDEPTASLDERIGRGLWEILEELSQQLTIVLVSHDIGAISQYVRSVACLNRRLHMHPSRELHPEIVEAAYGCPIEFVAHGHPHRVLSPHSPGGTS